MSTIIISLHLSLAQFFIDTYEKSIIISEVFDFFRFDCLERCNVNPTALDTLIREFESCEKPDADILARIITAVRHGSDDARGKERELVRLIEAYINENFTLDISIEEIAEKLNISYYYMCHIFKDSHKISVNTYRNNKRLEKAMRALCDGEDKITDIATACGFNNTSYFTEVFTKSVGLSPTAFRKSYTGRRFLDFYGFYDILLDTKLNRTEFIKDDITETDLKTETVLIHEPDERFKFLHEAAIIEHKGVLYASWYNCPINELRGYTPICEKRSFDGGKSWSELKIIAEDKTEKILYCPPVYGICDDRLYMLMNQMVAPDHIHSLDLYILNEQSGNFELLWSRPIPFKLNTNVITLKNGKLMLPGRIGELDGFPNTPAVLISDSGRIDDEWRIVKIAENGDLPDGKKLVHPEISVMQRDDRLYMFCRNDQRRVPLVYISEDYGESWSDAQSIDIPFVSSKIYSGELSNGRNYLIANTEEFDRSRLTLYLTEKGETGFSKRIILFDKDTSDIEKSYACHYPSAYEAGGKLYIIATLGYEDHSRGAVLFIVDTES